MGSKDAKHRSQMGMRLAVSRVAAQILQGAGNRTAARALMAVRNITRVGCWCDVAHTTRRVATGVDNKTTDARTIRTRVCTPVTSRSKPEEMNFVRLQLPLLRFFLARDAIARPRHGFQALLLQLFVAGIAIAVAAVFNTVQGLIDQVEQ
jgi:hypothetical protein